MNLNSYIGKPYNKETYHCWHFIEEALDVPTLNDVHVDTAKGDVEKYKGLFEEISSPNDYCIALLGSSHVGIYFRHNIYHNDTHGVRCESVRNIRMRYPSITYYKVKK